MGTRQQANLGDNGTNSCKIATVNSFAGIENRVANNVFLQLLECITDNLIGGSCIIFFNQGLLGFIARICHRFLAFLLVSNSISLANFGLNQIIKTTFNFAVIRHINRAWLFGTFFRQIDNRINHRLKFPVTEHDRTEHHIFRQFLGF